MGADVSDFGRLADGRAVQAVTLRACGTMARVLTLGATLQDVRLPGVPYSLTIGASDANAYLGPLLYAGAIVGPVANRIGGARVTLGGQDYRFQPNFGPHFVHSGPDGLHARIWEIAEAGPKSVTLRLDLPDGACGLPGNRRITARYALADAALSICLCAETDALTLMNLASHPYWNLDGSTDIAGHHLRIAADAYLPTDADRLPTGEVRPVDNTPFDLRAGHHLTLAEGFDHNFCLSDAPAPLRPVAWLTGRSGLRLTLETTAPGLQVFDGRSLSTGAAIGHGGRPYGAHAGLALEPQHWPDAPGNPHFPGILLKPGDVFLQDTRLSFAQASALRGQSIPGTT